MKMNKERWNPNDPGYAHLIRAEETSYTVEGSQKLIDVMARSGYSCRNSLLVYGQMAICKLNSITELRSEDAWDRIGRPVDPYCPGILISIPDKDPLTEETSYSTSYVYDLSQTKGGEDYSPSAKSGYLQTHGFVYAAKYILASMSLPKDRVVKAPCDLPVDYDVLTGKLIFSDSVSIDNTDALAWYAYVRAKLAFSDRPDADNMAKAVFQITARQVGAPIDERMMSFSIDNASYKTISDLYQASTGMLHRIEKEFQKTQGKSMSYEGGRDR